jgi:hypothetical protein
MIDEHDCVTIVVKTCGQQIIFGGPWELVISECFLADLEDMFGIKYNWSTLNIII